VSSFEDEEAMLKTVFMFSGQGSQYIHMGAELFATNDAFRQSMTRLDELARKMAGQSVLEAIYSKDKSKVFDRTLLTHPAIFMVEYSLAHCLMQSGVMPSMTLGASLGSFAAAAVAGFVQAEDVLHLVIKQAMALESCCEPGGMLAVLANPEIFAESFLSEHSELAGVNFATHFAVAARQSSLEKIESALRSRSIVFQRLPVSFAFHSRWIEAAQAPFESILESVGPMRGHLPLVCCDQAAVLAELSDTYFWRIVRQPIRFREAIAHLEREGAYRYIDVGPAGTLATFLKYGLSKTSHSAVHAILTPYGRDQKNLAALLKEVS
jgi:bacillaene synthase trans-acting acyltransferase